MVDFIAKYWLEVLFGAALAALSAAYHALSKRIREQDAIRLGIVALLRDRIIGFYNHYWAVSYTHLVFCRSAMGFLRRNHLGNTQQKADGFCRPLPKTIVSVN